MVVESKPDGSFPKKKKFWKILLIPVGVFIAPRFAPRAPVGGTRSPSRPVGARLLHRPPPACTGRARGGVLPAVASATEFRRCRFRARAPAAAFLRRAGACRAALSSRARQPSVAFTGRGAPFAHPLNRVPLRNDTAIRGCSWNRRRICPVLTGSPVPSGTATVRVGRDGRLSPPRGRHGLCWGVKPPPRCSWVRQPGARIGASAPFGSSPGRRRRGPRIRPGRESFGETFSNPEVQAPSAGT